MMPALTRPTRRNRFWPAALIFLYLLVASSFSLAAQEPTKSPNDANLYRYLQLDNGLGVLLVSDKSADKAADLARKTLDQQPQPHGKTRMH
ncbi:MAG TPA: hypothetical protein VGP45_00005 [Marinobacter sp.]|nr:hypothetical protein [Marinobacter sp.]